MQYSPVIGYAPLIISPSGPDDTNLGHELVLKGLDGSQVFLVDSRLPGADY